MSKFYLNVPVEQWDIYLEHIITKIYGVSEPDFKVTMDRGGIRRVEFRVDPIVPLINSLPETIHLNPPDSRYFEDVDRLQIITELLQQAVSDYKRPGGTFRPRFVIVNMTPTELPNVIRQLCRDRVIDRYLTLTDDRYLVTTLQMVMLLKVVNNALQIYLCAPDYTFDIDDGYTGTGIVELQPIWQAWRDAGDFTAPIHRPNYI